MFKEKVTLERYDYDKKNLAKIIDLLNDKIREISLKILELSDKQTIKMKKLYKVIFVNQLTGQNRTEYVLANSIQQIEIEYPDIISVSPINNFEDLTDENNN